MKRCIAGMPFPMLAILVFCGFVNFALRPLPAGEGVNLTVSGQAMGENEGTIFKKSHVPAWFDGPDDYKQYDVDVAVQKLDIIDRFDIPRAKAFVDQMHARGKLVCAEMHPATFYGEMLEYVMNEPGMQAAACVDLDLQPIPVGWMVGHTYHGKTPSFLCSNHPRYRAFLRQQIYYYTQAGVDGVMVDDGGGAFFAMSRGGCFCKYCMKGFREHLKSSVSEETLRKAGITDIDSFDYRQFVLRHVPNAGAYKAAMRRGEIPLGDEFTDFLRHSDVDLFRSLQAMAGALSKRHIPMGWDNVDFGGNRAEYYPFWDVFYPEINYQSYSVGARGPDEVLPPGIVMLNKVSDALGKWYTPTPAPRAWQAIRDGNLTGLLGQWIAFTYANGGAMRYPRKGWIFSEGDPWYYPPKEDFEPIYDFVRKHRSLLDDYEPLEQVGVLFTQSRQSAGAKYYSPLKHVCAGLVNANVPFGFAVAGDELLANRLVGDEANRCEIMLIPEPIRLIDGQQEIVDRWKAEGRAVAVTLDDDVASAIQGRCGSLLGLESESAVWLFPRKKPNVEAAPLVCHLVVSDFDPSSNRTRPQTNVAVRLGEGLFDGRPVKSVTYETIGKDPGELPFEESDDGIQVVVPSVEMWGVLKVERN